jgi:hypothetical protein
LPQTRLTFFWVVNSFWSHPYIHHVSRSNTSEQLYHFLPQKIWKVMPCILP